MTKKYLLLLSAAQIAVAFPACAQDADKAPKDGVQKSAAESEAAPAAPRGKAFTTGVAKGRDLLDSAISASALDDTEIEKLGPRSLAEVLRTIPGIRSEPGSGDADGSYTIRGLPLASSGSKYLQFQEDGLPVLEFGDINVLGFDDFLRLDRNVSQIQTIRGGSASTFASNSPGGVLNVISKTGDVKGGAVEFTSGLDYRSYRVDADYGAKLSDTLRFHIGGFYRQGEGPFKAGYDAYRGGQVKFNVTKDFAGGYVRLYGKYLNDRVPDYEQMPIRVTGTASDPSFHNVANFDIKSDSVLSKNFGTLVGLDEHNNRITINPRDGIHPIVKAIGGEGQVDVAGWTVSEKFRYSDISAKIFANFPLVTLPAPALAFALGGPGARLSYATGPNAGQVIANPAALNGNGLLSEELLLNFRVHNLNDLTNDVRATRAWDLGGGTLTTTAGTYHARQNLHTDIFAQTGLVDVIGGGNAALVDVTNVRGTKVTQGGIVAFGIPAVGPSGPGPAPRREYNVHYTIDAPYGSLNYHIGKIAIGGSLRYDIGRARGSINGGELGGGRLGVTSFDINGDGQISPAERDVVLLPQTNAAPVHYNYHYLSYSVGVNYRVAEDFATFARYSRGARAGADRLLFSPTVSSTTGDLVGSKGYDPVKQAEIGAKFRHNALTLNLTGFWASANEQNTQLNSSAGGNTQFVTIVRKYSAKGLEFEGGYSIGAFRLAANATYTKAKIKSDATDATLAGNVPRHQPELSYSVTPQFETERFTIGTNVTGVTSSYAQDINKLKMPGYQTVNAFLQYRPIDRLQFSIEANNVFNVLGFTEITQGDIPANGLVLPLAMPGRTVSASVRVSL